MLRNGASKQNQMLLHIRNSQDYVYEGHLVNKILLETPDSMAFDNQVTRAVGMLIKIVFMTFDLVIPVWYQAIFCLQKKFEIYSSDWSTSHNLFYAAKWFRSHAMGA